MSINIHGKEYITVAERVSEAHKNANGILSITTEVLFQTPVVIKATVTTKNGVFTGISAANPLKTIEKASPYEVAETSAVGRALGFAGYGMVEGIATADEVVKAEADPTEDWPKQEEQFCKIHNKPMKERTAKNGGHYYDHRWQDESGNWKKCNGEVTS